MDENELKKVAMIYFGITPTPKISKNSQIEIIYPEDLDVVEIRKDLKIKWENHIGTESKIARITPLDLMYYLHMKNTKENLKKAILILKGLAKAYNLPLIKVEDRYLLVNPKHRG